VWTGVLAGNGSCSIWIWLDSDNNSACTWQAGGIGPDHVWLGGLGPVEGDTTFTLTFGQAEDGSGCAAGAQPDRTRLGDAHTKHRDRAAACREAVDDAIAWTTELIAPMTQRTGFGTADGPARSRRGGTLHHVLSGRERRPARRSVRRGDAGAVERVCSRPRCRECYDRAMGHRDEAHDVRCQVPSRPLSSRRLHDEISLDSARAASTGPPGRVR
jgi:hypothetical protein